MAVGPMAASLDPSAVDAFIQQLGIHPTEVEDFSWIAEVGLRSPLPPRWTSHTDDATGYIYYIDHDRQVSEWENPLVPYLRRVVEIGRGYLQSEDQEAYFEEQKHLLWHQHKQDLECWHGPFTDPEGRQYYVNSVAGLSSWQDPRVDAQYMFELESGLLTTLQEVLPEPAAPNTPGFGPGDSAVKWNTADGAEVLTLEASPTTRRSRPPTGIHRQLAATGNGFPEGSRNAMQHRSMAEKMTVKAKQVGAAKQDEEEVQRLQIFKKAEERKRRLKKAAAVAAAAAAGAESRQLDPSAFAAPGPVGQSVEIISKVHPPPLDPTLSSEMVPAALAALGTESLLCGKLSPSNEEATFVGPPREQADSPVPPKPPPAGPASGKNSPNHLQVKEGDFLPTSWSETLA